MFWAGGGGALIGGAMGAGTAYAQYLGAKKQNQWNLERRNDAWRREERLANSVHQREVDDLRAAGLNPILSAGGSGNPSPVGGIITSTDPAKGVEGTASSAMQAARLSADLGLLKESKRKTSAEADAAEAGAFSAKNRMAFEKKYPRLFGGIDAVLKRLSPATGVLGGFLGGTVGAALRGKGGMRSKKYSKPGKWHDLKTFYPEPKYKSRGPGY